MHYLLLQGSRDSGTLKTSCSTFLTVRCHIPEEGYLQGHHCDNIKSQTGTLEWHCIEEEKISDPWLFNVLKRPTSVFNKNCVCISYVFNASSMHGYFILLNSTIILPGETSNYEAYFFHIPPPHPAAASPLFSHPSNQI
jgi:hypothetical protein